MQDAQANPYEPGLLFRPFAGREAQFTRIIQHLTDPVNVPVPVFLGRAGIGKTALLQRAGTVLDENTISLYIPLKVAPLHEESAWIRALYQSLLDTLPQRRINMDRLPEIPAECDDWRVWLRDDVLPEVFRSIWRTRRLVFLLDDARYLLDAIERGDLPDDFGAFMHSLRHAQLGFALTASVEDETRLDTLAPLIEQAGYDRLQHLIPEDVGTVLAEVQAGHEPVETVITAVYRATGGRPELVQRFGYHLYEKGPYLESPLTTNSVKLVRSQVYTDSEDTFKADWDGFNQNERLVLTAMASLLYHTPLKPLAPAQIENWLVQTDFPVDVTAINAALRSLEYREIVTATGTGITISAGLMQSWLLDHARLDGVPSPGRAPETDETQGHPALWIAVAAAIILVLVLAAVLAAQGNTVVIPPDNLVPTVTLVPGN